jgi:site-specific DNA-methyltransferase (adenine-specific)
MLVGDDIRFFKMSEIISEVFNEDCMAVMARYPDKYFDLAICDPPYGIDIAEKSDRLGKAKTKWASGGSFKHYEYSDWDKNTPNEEYWFELFRVSKNQIVWGWNFYDYNFPKTKCFLVWDKIGRDDRADGELAWTSFNKPAKIFRYSRADAYINDCDLKIHPTQKPVKLYDWILKNYANKGDKILDTHLGSGSSRIAAHRAGLLFVGCELDKDYFDAQEKRFKDYVSQLKLF